MRLRNLFLFWLTAALLFGLSIYVFSSILLPFVAGMALAYLLDPIADWLERRGMSRIFAASTILLLFALITATALLVLVPVLVDQMSGFLSHLPDYVNKLQRFANEQAGSRLFKALRLSSTDVKSSLGGLVTGGASWLSTFVTSLWNGGQALVSVVSLMVVTPVVAFYMLLDWDRMIAVIDGWVPLYHKKTVRDLARQMDAGVSGFVRGQVSVSALLGLFYAVALSLAGLNFGLLIGLFAGLISFIPYVGSTVTAAIALGVATVQYWPDWSGIVWVFGIFAVGQFIEGNILQPKLIGSSVGLHPVWLMFALLAFGTLFGFLGLLIAVPAASAVAVLLRFAIGKYLESPFYHGLPGHRPLNEIDYQRRDDDHP